MRKKKYDHSNRTNYDKKLNFEDTVAVTEDHGLCRWNQRVIEPKMESTDELNSYLQECINQNKIRHLVDDVYLIDNDVVAVITTSNVGPNTRYFRTFLGRQSINPMLYNIKSLVCSMRKSGKKYGKINLDYEYWAA